MTLHVVGLPHTQVTRAYSSCAYTEKVRKFSNMMTNAGHDVILYAGEEADCKFKEHVVCIREGERRALTAGVPHYTQTPFNSNNSYWKGFNSQVSHEVRKRAKERDFLCLIGGLAHKDICDFLPDLRPLGPKPLVPAVEWGVGYGGVFSQFRVWESYAWMHHILGFLTARSGKNSHDCDGPFYDSVIPNYFDPEDFPLTEPQDGNEYILYVGRMIDRKGIEIVRQVAEASGRPLIMAGPGNPPAWAREFYAGELDPKRRFKLMKGAHCLLAPTQYIEPFGTVAIEAMACGTPVVSTDWGGFTETVRQGLSGYRCRTLQQFVDAITACEGLNRAAIRDYAVANYSTPVIQQAYVNYFDMLTTLWGKGWSELRDDAHGTRNSRLLRSARDLSGGSRTVTADPAILSG